MTENKETDRPLVTFALFAYNQEKYIREAIEGAISQTYGPLEIILSDDCSSDETFKIMQEVVGSYEGPHHLRARQNSDNMGILGHVLNVAKEAQGTYLVVAAGDDISKPERTEISIASMNENQWVALSTACDEFQDGDLSNARTFPAVKPSRHKLLKGEPIIQQIHGASSVYKTSFLRALPLPKERVFLEDFVLQILAYTKDQKVGAIESSLISRRIHADNIGPGSLRSKKKSILDEERVIERHHERILQSFIYIKETIMLPNIFKNNLDDYLYIRARWRSASISERARLFLYALKFGNPRRDILRALGPKPFSFFLNKKRSH